MPITVIRPATLNDAATLSKLGRETFTETFGHLYSAEDLSAYLNTHFSPEIQAAELSDASNRHWIAEVNGVPAGFAKAGNYKLPLQTPDHPVCELHRLYVLTRYQGLGLGSEMLEASFGYARTRGAAELYLGVWENNLKAQDFYCRQGFLPCGTYHFHVGNQADNEIILRAPVAPMRPFFTEARQAELIDA